MEPLTTTVIVTLALTKAIEKTAETLTQGTLSKINQLRKKIWDKLKGNKKAETALAQAQQGSESDLETVAAYLRVAMDSDDDFNQEVQTLAHEIQQEMNIGKIQGQNVQNVYGGKAEQNNVSGNNAPVVQGGSNHTITFNTTNNT